MKNWSRADLREQIEAAAYQINEPRGHGVDNRLIGRWETGAITTPQAVYRRLLAHIGAPLPIRAMPTVSGIEDEETMNRRRFLHSAGTAVALAVGAPAAAYYGAEPRSTRIDAAYVRELRATMDNLYREDQNVGGANLSAAALQKYYDVRRVLDESEYSIRVGRDLMSIAGEMAVCAGWLSFDAGDQRGSRSLYSEAFLMADQSDDNRLAIQALEKMTLQSAFIADRAHHRGSSREAVRIGDRVAEIARRESSARLHALVASRHAIAYATIGDESEFRKSIARAWREIERCDPNEEEAWLQFVSPNEVRIQEAKGYRYLGKPEESVRLYRAALRQDDVPVRNRVNYHAQLASSLSALGDNVSAIAEGMAVLPLLEDVVASPRSVAELHPVRRAAEAARNTEFCTRYDRISANSTEEV